jgi:hypothetical protein
LAIARWQASHGLRADGKLGATSRIALGMNEEFDIPMPLADADLGPKDEEAEAKKKDATMKADGAAFVRVVDQITSLMEGGRAEGRYETLTPINDGGGVSYGKHQATLTSGTLELLLNKYLELAKPDSANRKIVEQHMAQVRSKDMALKKATAWKNALIDAAKNEQEMRDAQDFLFSSHYGKPAFDAAEGWGITSVLGHAILYDTRVQGGMETLLSRTKSALGGTIGQEVKGKKIAEVDFLTKFNDLREARLNSLAASARNRGRSARAEALSNSRYRTRSFRELLLAGNLNVAGPEGKLRILGPGGDRYDIQTFDSGDYKGGVQAGSKIGVATVTAARLLLRNKPSLNGGRLDSLVSGTQVNVIGEEGAWLKVEILGAIGYLHTRYVDYQKNADKGEEGKASA